MGFMPMHSVQESTFYVSVLGPSDNFTFQLVQIVFRCEVSPYVHHAAPSCLFDGGIAVCRAIRQGDFRHTHFP